MEKNEATIFEVYEDKQRRYEDEIARLRKELHQQDDGSRKVRVSLQGQVCYYGMQCCTALLCRDVRVYFSVCIAYCMHFLMQYIIKANLWYLVGRECHEVTAQWKMN